MKTSKISMMLIGMMMLSTTTSFGKTNGQPRNEMNQPRQERGYSQNNNRRGGDMGQMDNRHFDNGRTYDMQPVSHRVEPRPVPHPEPLPMPEPEPRPVVHHCSNVGDVVGGVVVGTVIGTVLGSLIH